MSEDRPPLSDDEVVALVRKTIEQAREDTTRRTEPDVVKDLAQPGITIDLGHHAIRRLPEEVIDIIKADIERCVVACRPVTAAAPGASLRGKLITRACTRWGLDTP